MQENDDGAQVLEGIVERNAFYRDSWRKSYRVIFWLAGCLVASITLNVVLLLTHKDPLPIAVTPDGRVMKVTPLTEDALGGDGVRQWAARTLPSLYDLDFRRYREQMASLERVFTPAGYKGYLEAVRRFDLLDTIKSNNYIVGAAPRATPQVIATGTMDGRRYWKVRAPMLVTFDNGSTPLTQNLMVTAYIVRVPETKNPYGLSIHSFAATRG